MNSSSDNLQIAQPADSAGGRRLVRWYVKKSARAGVALGLGGLRVLRARLGNGAAGRVRALTYHRFGDSPRDPFCVPAQAFEAQVASLAREGRAVSLEQLLDALAGRATLPADACLVTIDDGMISTLETALPILEHHGVPAVAFVSTKLIGADLPGLEERYMTWEELARLARSPVVAVGSHAHTHRSLGEMPLAEAVLEVTTSKQILQERLGVEVQAFAYPFGMIRDFSAAVDTAIRDAGYRIAFNSMHGAIRPGMAAGGSLPRVKIEGGEPGWLFSLISHGALDPWRVVDDHLWRLQRVRREIG